MLSLHNDRTFRVRSVIQSCLQTRYVSPVFISLFGPEAAFFRDAMRLTHSTQEDGEPITYERLCALFKKHI